jgi:hypothetical protein
MRKFVELTSEEKLAVVSRWNFKSNVANIYVNEHLVPFTLHKNCYVNAGTVRATALICGGFHNKELRQNPSNRVNQVL